MRAGAQPEGHLTVFSAPHSVTWPGAQGWHSPLVASCWCSHVPEARWTGAFPAGARWACPSPAFPGRLAVILLRPVLKPSVPCPLCINTSACHSDSPLTARFPHCPSSGPSVGLSPTAGSLSLMFTVASLLTYALSPTATSPPGKPFVADHSTVRGSYSASHSHWQGPLVAP